MSNKFSKQYTINIYDVDANYNCKYSTLMNYLWDVVVSQSDALGETDHGIIDNCAWVLLKYDLNILKYPKFRDTVSVETDIIGIKKLYGYRSFTIRDSEGTVILSGISTAILIDLVKRCPVKMSSEQCKVYGIEKELEEALPLDDFINFEEVFYEKEYAIRQSALDVYRHVNNVKYIEMAIDTLPKEFLDTYKLSAIKVLFKKEATQDSILHISSHIIESNAYELTSMHTISDSHSDKPITKLEFKWLK